MPSANVVSPLAAGLFNRRSSGASCSIRFIERRRRAWDCILERCRVRLRSARMSRLLARLSVETILKLQGQKAQTVPTSPLPRLRMARSCRARDCSMLSGTASSPTCHDSALRMTNTVSRSRSTSVFPRSRNRPFPKRDVRKYVETVMARMLRSACTYPPSSTPLLNCASTRLNRVAHCPQQAVNQTLSSQVPLYAMFNRPTGLLFPELPGFQSLAYQQPHSILFQVARWRRMAPGSTCAGAIRTHL